jgi:DNA-3-methyladenine glycosylase II
MVRDRFTALAKSIVSQQISGKAAASIWQRLSDALDGNVCADGLRRMDLEQLRATGISRQKGVYLLDLAERVADGRVALSQIGRREDEQVIAELIQVKGIGRWTAQMFLIFSLGRLDVLPVDDLGIRTAIRNRYGLKELPRACEIEAIAQPWRPYATVASWYLWQSLDL